ncbi:MAG TPA: cyclic nucleotide-binding domain-containing protein [Vicinamibacteria bacterium]|nr:cyclic nucleotide-binding domain-containing protein [Vicinamibacteria bacterium]
MTDPAVKESLAASPLFAEVPPAALDDLGSACTLQRVAAGTTVLKEGDEGDAMYVIRKGRVRVEKRTPYQDHFTVTFLEDGAFFGELALLDRDQRSATVVAETDAEFVIVQRDCFLQFGDRHPPAGLAVTRRIARNLAERLRRTNRDVVTLFSALVHEIEESL